MKESLRLPITECKMLDNGKKALIVDGRPFLTLGAQIRIDRWVIQAGWTYERLSEIGIVGWAKKLNCNTVQIPLCWKEIEPAQGRFEWSALSWMLLECRKYELKLEIVWFGSNVCGAGWHSMTPDWITGDPERYTRIFFQDGTALGADTIHPSDGQKYTLCVENPYLLEAERHTITSMMAYLHEHDKEGIVIGFQVENEPSLVQHNPVLHETDRCHCARCNSLYKEGGYDNAFDFSKDSLTGYLDTVASFVKASSHPLFTRVNWIHPYLDLGFDEDTDRVLRNAPHVDCVGYDTYGKSQAEIYELLTGDLSLKRGNAPHLGELEGGLHGCAEKIMDLLAANGVGVSVYQLAGYVDADDNYLLYPTGKDARPWSEEVRLTYGMLNKANEALARSRNSVGSEIRFFNGEGQTNPAFSGTQVLGDYEISYDSKEGGIGISLLNEGDIVLMSYKRGSFAITSFTANRAENGHFASSGEWKKTMEKACQIVDGKAVVALHAYEVVKLVRP
ncbi:DUF4978 domain-containing protein [Cohnella silvisoli]|uniref:DUF4978 domain-containing protein n=1 Tax=Cohnella silvisoli TaxID=2873699 RepID=A0ABV1L1Z6_9BACL|nr:DUF4978 domain-containing protein [Cohnella silvisoli]MCD9025703.1 DUF4978 domain-containing protein [Cohnella silvisoli]